MASFAADLAPLAPSGSLGVCSDGGYGFATLGFIGPIGYQEMMVLAVVGVLIFGRRLPEVGKQLGKTLTGLRGTLQDFKDQINADEDLREAKSAITDIRRTLETPMQTAQSFTDPKRLFDQLTHEEFASPGPEVTRVEAAAPSVFEQEADKLAQAADGPAGDGLAGSQPADDPASR